MREVTHLGVGERVATHGDVCHTGLTRAKSQVQRAYRIRIPRSRDREPVPIGLNGVSGLRNRTDRRGERAETLAVHRTQCDGVAALVKTFPLLAVTFGACRISY